MLWEEPRSTSSHWGSEKAEDQRVPVLPSVASAAGVPAFSVEDAVVVLPWESRVGAAWAAVLVATSAVAKARLNARSSPAGESEVSVPFCGSTPRGRYSWRGESVYGAELIGRPDADDHQKGQAGQVDSTLSA